MSWRPSIVAVLLVQSLAFSLSAQQPAAEYGRATGGEILATTKGTAPLTGSLELSLSSGGMFGNSSAPGIALTGGGTLIQDRLWFFASASRQQIPATRIGDFDLPQSIDASSFGAKMSGQVAANHDFSASFNTARQPALSIHGEAPVNTTLPSSFLSLRYDGIVSSTMSFSASFSRSSRTLQGFGYPSTQ